MQSKCAKILLPEVMLASKEETFHWFSLETVTFFSGNVKLYSLFPIDMLHHVFDSVPQIMLLFG